MMKTTNIIVLILLIVVGGVACKGKSEENKLKMTRVTIAYTTTTTPLYFSGSISPLNVVNVTTPVDGIIRSQYFSYGDKVTVKQKLFEVASEKMASDFLSAVSEYLKALDDYNSKKRQFEGSQELWKLKFISQNDYFNDKTASDESYFGLQQSIANVVAKARQVGITADLQKVNLTDPDMIKRIVQTRRNILPVFSTATGIALYPLKTESSSGGGGKGALSPGSDVKQDQVLVSVGNMNGLTVNIEVGEVDVNLLRAGQAATVTGPAFANIILNGSVSSVNKQATASSGALPTFPVTITIPTLTEEEKQIIHVGMSATVTIEMKTENIITLPIDAVYLKGDKATVKVEDQKTKKINEVTVKTGKSGLDSIEISQGLKPGDVVVYYH